MPKSRASTTATSAIRWHEVAHWGSFSFGVVLGDIAADNAKARALDLHRSVRRLDISLPNQTLLHITISMGGAVSGPEDTQRAC